MSTVKWSPTTAALANASPGTIVCGSPGSGKTFFLINVAANCMGIGQRVIAIDPKNDFNKLYNVNKNIKIIDISNISPGALNPFTFLAKTNKETGEEESIDTATLMSIIELLCGKLSSDVTTAITPIVTDFVTKSRNSDDYVDMQDVADYLFANKSEQAQLVGTLLRMYEDNQHGKLLFTREQNVEPLRFNNTDNMVITLHGLALPDYNKSIDDYDPNERLTSCIIYIIARKLMDILSSDVEVPTTLFCDEAHLLFVNREMSTIIDRFLRLGRSLNVATVLASQGISNFPEGISNYITTKFLFRSSIDEATNFLNRFDTSKLDTSNAIDVNSVIAAITKFPTGICYMIDRAGRNGVIRIVSIYDKDLITSNPFAKKRDKDNSENEEDLKE